MTAKVWFHSLAATFVGGIATAIANANITPDLLNSPAGLRHLGLAALAGGVVTAAAYLIKSPVPPSDPPADKRTPTPPVATLIAALFFLAGASSFATDHVIVDRGGSITLDATARFKLWDGTDTALVTSGGLLQVDASGATVPVSGTFWQATQPVSGTFWQTTQPVSGTFWQATQPVSAAILPLPTGASTAANQSTANTSLSSIDGKITAVNTGAVVISSSALPSGAATSANQSTQITSLSTIATNTTSIATAANQTTANTSLSSIDGKITAVNTGAVVISSSALPSGAATSANQSTELTSLSTIATNTTSIATAANQATANTSLSSILTNTALLGTGAITIGNVASGVSDSGAPIKTGAKYNSTKPTFTDGQRGDLQIGTRGSLCVQLVGADSATAVTASSGSDSSTSGGSIWTVAHAESYNGSTWERLRVANVFKPFTISASSSETTVWTPTSAKKFRMLGYTLYSDTATVLTFRDNTLGTIVWKDGVAAAARAPSPPMGNGVLSAAANNVLTLQATTSSTINGTVFGTEE